MPRPEAARGTPLATATGPRKGGDLLLFPSIFLEHGAIVFPKEGGEAGGEEYQALMGVSGAPVDLFDAVDHLLALYHRIYVVDVEGVREERPQFEYLQELTKGQEEWVDAGARDSDQVMDVLVAGASRAVLSTPTLRSAREISTSLKLTSQVALEIVHDHGRVAAHDRGLDNAPVEELASEARAAGVSHIILSSDERTVDWSLVRRVAEGGPTFVGGRFFTESRSELASAGARGGIFSAKELLERWTTSGS
ncbi:MAG: hypothetical protein KGI89_13775 [Euryarchaeota archaeon]|nr:hypothetical protein [Euryarchaeota archaeon]